MKLIPEEKMTDSISDQPVTLPAITGTMVTQIKNEQLGKI